MLARAAARDGTTVQTNALTPNKKPGGSSRPPGTREGKGTYVLYSSTGFFQKDRISAPTTEPATMATSHMRGLPMTGSTQAPP